MSIPNYFDLEQYPISEPINTLVVAADMPLGKTAQATVGQFFRNPFDLEDIRIKERTSLAVHSERSRNDAVIYRINAETDYIDPSLDGQFIAAFGLHRVITKARIRDVFPQTETEITAGSFGLMAYALRTPERFITVARSTNDETSEALVRLIFQKTIG